MTEVSSFLERLGFLGNAGAFAAALGAICLIQYLLHLYNGRRSRKENKQIRRELERVVDRVSCLESDRALAELESRVLRKLAEAATVDEALTTLLAHCIPDANAGFGAYLELRSDGRTHVRIARGLSQASRRRLDVDPEWMLQLAQRSVLRLANREARRSAFFSRLPPDEQELVSELVVFRIGSAQQPSGMFVASDLAPEGTSLEGRIELVQRLLSTMGNLLHRTEALEQQQDELRLTREIIDLRCLVDTHLGTPIELLEEFLGRVAETTGFDRATLHLASGMQLDAKPLVCVGERLPRAIADLWKLDEATLARKGLRATERLFFNDADLRALKLRSNMTGAFVAPLSHEDTHIGVINLTRAGEGVVSTSDRELLIWAVDYLRETILRSVDRAIIEQQARRDALTQLANRGTFDREIARRVEEAVQSGAPCSLVMLDIDHFKSLNDRFGHQAGDEVLRNVARIIQSCATRTRASDRSLTARYGGEELAVILPGVDQDVASRIGDEIVESIRQSDVLYEGTTIELTISAGVATAPRHGTTASELIAAADAALYLAKDSGRDRCEVAHDVPRGRRTAVGVALEAV